MSCKNGMVKAEMENAVLLCTLFSSSLSGSATSLAGGPTALPINGACLNFWEKLWGSPRVCAQMQ